MVRDFARAMGGPEFSASMELPRCMSRTRAATEGGFLDGWDQDGFYNGRIRVPIEIKDVELKNVSIYRNDFPKMAYLELKNRLPYSSEENRLEGWSALVVLPPLKDASDPVGPRFAAANVSFSGHPLPHSDVHQMPGVQTRIYLGSIEKVLRATDGPLKLDVLLLKNLAPSSDSGTTKVTIRTQFPQLRADLSKMADEIHALKRRDKQKHCNVLASTCRDGECG